MPYISCTTNHKLTLRQENEITSKLGEIITIIPGKKEENLMIHLSDDQIMYFRGSDDPCMMIEVHLYNTADFECKKQFTERLTRMINIETNIDVDNIYVSFKEYPNWGKLGTLI